MTRRQHPSKERPLCHVCSCNDEPSDGSGPGSKRPGCPNGRHEAHLMVEFSPGYFACLLHDAAGDRVRHSPMLP